MIRLLPLIGLASSAAVLTAAQCGRADGVPTGFANEPRPKWASPDSLRTISARVNPCTFVHEYDASRLVGPVVGLEWQAKSAHDTTSDPNGIACIMRLAPRPGVPPESFFAIELVTEGAIAFETGAAEMNRAAKNMLHLIGAKTADGAQHFVNGWDYLGAYPREMTGRVGHIAIHADWGGVAVPLDSVEKLMRMMRDAIPDRPFDAFGRGSEAGEEDPCSLITRNEADSVLTKLAAPPYESRDLSGLADKNGTGCSYYWPNHEVLSIRPWWSNGKVVFNVSGATLPTGLASYGNLPRPWDKEAADPVGNFYFLKGDRLVALSWKTSGLSEYGAYRFAVFAMKRLAK